MMKILIDIGHPGQVHYFRNFIFEMQKRGHEFCIIAREKDVTTTLLTNYHLGFINRGVGGRSIWAKIFYIITGTLKVYKVAKKFKPDLLMSFGSIYISYTSLLIGRPHIAFDDTERSLKKIWTIGADNVLTPNCYQRNLGSKHVRFSSYMEAGHLHPKRFLSKPEVFNLLGIPQSKKFIILRFVSWQASHDVGQGGLTYSYKKRLVDTLSKDYLVFISSEGKLPADLEKFKIKTPVHLFHDLLSYASLCISEGTTTASECALLGTPNIVINTITTGYTYEQSKIYKTSFHYKNESGVIEKAMEIIENSEFLVEFKTAHKRMLNDLIDLTAFMIWYVENWPTSFSIMKENPNYQYNFR